MDYGITTMDLQPIKKTSAVDTVIDFIKNQLIEKKMYPGQKLPGEIEIAEGLGVGRSTVREAMKILSAFGVVSIRSGDGTYISESSKGGRLNPLIFDFLLYGPDKNELIQFRQAIEIAIVELIILNKDKNDEQRSRLEQNLEEMRLLSEEGASSVEAFAQKDIAFHRLMGEASCNYLACKVYEFVLGFIEPTIAKTHTMQKNGEVAYTVHRGIVRAIQTNDLFRARDEINRSVQIWDTLIDESASSSKNCAKN